MAYPATTFTSALEQAAQACVERYRSIAPDAEAFYRALLTPLPHCLWVNTLRITPAELAAILQQDDILLSPLPWHPSAFQVLSAVETLGRHWSARAGLFQIQEAVSMLPVRLLPEQEINRAVDLCAAPGNKAAELALRMNNRGTLLASDSSYTRLRALGNTMKRLGLLNISTLTADARLLAPINNSFDVVLADVPCGCEGTFRKNHRHPITPNPASSRTMAQQQYTILQKALLLCRPGGQVMYSTCTFAPEENEAVIDRLCREYSRTVRVLPLKLPGLTSSPGVTQWEGQTYVEEVAHTLRVWPQQNDTGGFFVALLEKKQASPPRLEYQTQLSQAALDNPTVLRVWEDFGLPTELLANHSVIENKRGIYVLAPGHDVVSSWDLDSSGLFLIKLQTLPIKLTTEAARLFGMHATKQYIKVTALQREAYLEREMVMLADEQILPATHTGYVLIQYDGFCLGLGMLKRDDEKAQWWLVSLYPKHG